ncbi:MAG: ATP-dependent helicase, partial [Chloroflexota bacterium]|nr:ATP-dependent helicase [Chloroflexota bacterium]
GKTQVITRRIAWLIGTRRAKPSEVLGLTFTDKAADEMQVRVDQLVPYGYTDTAIGTFHAFGDRLIREFALELGLPTDVRVLSRPETVIFLREHLFEFELDEYRPLGDPTRFLSALASLFSRCKDEDIAPAAYLDHANRVAAEAAAVADAVAATDDTTDADRDAADAAAETARRQIELARTYGRYQELLAANGFIDFGDQVGLALRLVRESPAIREQLQRRFRYVLVDEFQDTNRAQSELVALLAEPHRNVTVVGDDDQSIYKFRGAAISNILEFQERFHGARVVVLRRNYRSLAPILDASYRLVRFNDPDRLEVRSGLSKRLRPERVRDAQPPVRLEAFATGSEEADWVAAEIGRRIAAGARPRDHAVLVRANAAADPILRSLNLAAIPWRFSGTSGLYARPEVRLLLAFLRSVADPASSVDVYGLAASDVYALGGPDLTAIVNSARRRNRSLWDVLEELDRQPGILRVGPETRAAVTKLVADMRGYLRLAHERPAGEVLYAFLRGTGLLSRLAATDSVAAEEALQNIARFFEIVRAQSALLADDRAIFVARHLQTLIQAGDDPPTAEVDPDADAVAVLTVHKAKGLEFPVVFLPGLVTDRFPARSRPDTLALPLDLVKETLPEGDYQLQEERRLFYVAMTRARDELILSHAADYGGARARRTSPFVLEALDLPVAAGTPGSGARASTPLERLASFEPTLTAAPAERGPSDEPLVLSFSAIDDYLTCPLKFKYGHVLRVPLAPHHAMVYGAALHKAVQEFHRRQARGEPMTEAELFDAFDRAWSNEGFLSRDHEEARLDSGRAALRRFREEQLGPDAVVPAYVEREFSFILDGDRVRGRWDRVDIEPADLEAVGPGPTPTNAHAPHADVVTPTLPLLGRERVTITDYKSSDVRD